MGKVMAICISEKRGTQKNRVETAVLTENYGIKGDAHAGNWHRQVSLLSFDTIDAFKQRGAEIEDGAFGENIIVQGIDLINLPIGTKLVCGEIVLKLTQIGKECHSHCQIYQKMGECIMPSNGVFTKVLHGGRMNEGDEINLCTEQEL